MEIIYLLKYLLFSIVLPFCSDDNFPVLQDIEMYVQTENLLTDTQLDTMGFNPISDSLTIEINKKLSEFSSATISSHIESYGFLILDKAHKEIEANGKVYKVSIPFIRNEKVEAIMFAYPLHDGSEAIILELIPAEIFEMSDQDVLDILTVETTLLAMSAFSRHQLWVNAKYVREYQERLTAFFKRHPLPR